MSALTDLFTAMANKIRSKTGTQTTYTPAEMVSDGIDDVFDAATTSITPGNLPPVQMTANVGYKPTAGGYAISSYTEVTPEEGSFTTLWRDTIYKISGSSGIFTRDETIKSLVPSNSTPATISNGTYYNAGDSGYAIKSYSTKTPDDLIPPSIASGAIIKAGSAGYLTKNLHPLIGSAPDKIYTNNSMSNNATASITVTKKPRYIVMWMTKSGTADSNFVGLVDVGNATAYKYGYYSGASQNDAWPGYTSYITSITASSVSIKNVYGSTVRVAVGCYY